MYVCKDYDFVRFKKELILLVQVSMPQIITRECNVICCASSREIHEFSMVCQNINVKFGGHKVNMKMIVATSLS